MAIAVDAAAFLKALEKERKAVGFAQTVALTRTAKATSTFLNEEIGRVFDRPTPFTRRAVTWLSARGDKRKLDIFVRFFAPKGVAAEKYLLAQVRGGSRRQKRSESALARYGLMRGLSFWVPARGLKLDAYGNVPGATMRRILSDLQAAGDQSRTARSEARNKRYRRERYFVPEDGSGLKPGVYVRRGGRVSAVLIFVAAVSYRPRFDFFGRGMGFALARYPDELRLALQQGYGRPKR